MTKAQLLTQKNREKEYPTRIVSVVFGNPRSEECAGYGLCKLDEDGDIPPMGPKPKPKMALISCSQRYSAAVTRVEAADGRVGLAFEFSKKELNPDVLKKYFGGKQFTVGSGLNLPESLTEAFDLDASSLKAGLYDILEKNTSYRVLLAVK
jgi:hypothetical protein